MLKALIKQRRENRMNVWDKVAYVLVVVGGLNWGLIAFFDYNLVTELFGSSEDVVRVIYGAVGLAAAYMTYTMLVMMNKPAKKK